MSKFVVCTYWWGRGNYNFNTQRPCPLDVKSTMNVCKCLFENFGVSMSETEILNNMMSEGILSNLGTKVISTCFTIYLFLEVVRHIGSVEIALML